MKLYSSFISALGMLIIIISFLRLSDCKLILYDGFQVILWVVASLLTLVEDVFSEEDKEVQSDLQRVLRQSPMSLSAENLEQDSSIYTVWPEAFGKHFMILFHQQGISMASTCMMNSKVVDGSSVRTGEKRANPYRSIIK